MGMVRAEAWERITEQIGHRSTGPWTLDPEGSGFH